MISAPTSQLPPTGRETARRPSREEFLRAHYRFQEGRFFTAVQINDEAIHAASDIAVPMWNHSTAFAGDTEAWHDKHGRRPVVYLIDEAKEIAGYEIFDRETWMVRDVELGDSSSSDFKIEEAIDLREFTDVFRSAFSISSAAYDAALRRGASGNQKHLIARIGTDPVAVGTVIFEGDLACIYNVGSAPRFRGRGAGGAMMEAAIRVSRAEGARWVFLQVESGSLAERLYIKLGFKPFFHRTGYRKTDWTPGLIEPDTALNRTLTAAEKKQTLEEWSRGGDIAWNGESIVELLEARAKQSANATALILAESAELKENPTLNFADLMSRASERACALIQAGVKPGSSVGVLLPRSLETVESLLAIWRAGGVFVPLDSSYPVQRIQFMAGDCAMKAVVTTQALAHLAPAGVPKVFVESTERYPSAAWARVEPNDPAYIIYTSGSTGQPKGVVLSHGAIAQHTLAMIDYYKITANDRHLHFSPFTFDASFEQLLPPLVAGASVVIRNESLWDTSEFIRNLSAFDLTIVDIPVAYWRQLAQEAVGLSRESLSPKLRLVIVGGEAMARDRLAQWQQGPFGDRRLVNAYGPTEATITATAFEAADFKAISSSNVPIGRPLPGRLVYILDDTLEPVPVHVAGQLYIGGPLLALGYLNQPELTRERFIKNPFAEGQLYATGDVARFLEDGAIEFLGRADDQVKIRGFRIELGEIEVALQEHPSVREAVVIAKDDGAGQKRLVGYVTSRNGPVNERDLRQWLRSRLPEYMAPTAIVSLEELPLLNSGKVNRKALPDAIETPSSAPGLTPKTPLELQLQILFQRVLRRNGVGVDESFFELGGDSLQALELIVQIEKATGRRLPLETLFQTPTVERLATEVQRAASGDDWSCLVTLQKSGTRPPLFLIHTTPGDVLGYGNLIHHLGDDQPCYGFQALGLKDAAQPHTTIEGMAAHYVELLRKFQPQGPYYLGGWCFGGIVAVEMAQQLKAAGHQVAPLFLMETISVPPSLGNFKYHAARLKCLFSMAPERWREYLSAKAKYRRQVELDNRMRFRQAGEDVDPGQRLWLERLEQVYNANLAALETYQSQFFDGKVILFNAVEKDPGILPDPNYGWTGLAREIEIHEVAGNHDTMLAEPNVSSLATAIRKVLS